MQKHILLAGESNNSHSFSGWWRGQWARDGFHRPGQSQVRPHHHWQSINGPWSFRLSGKVEKQSQNKNVQMSNWELGQAMFQYLHSGGCCQRSVEREQPVDSSQVQRSSHNFHKFPQNALTFCDYSQIKHFLKIPLSGAGSRSRGKPPTIRTTIEVILRKCFYYGALLGEVNKHLKQDHLRMNDSTRLNNHLRSIDCFL